MLPERMGEADSSAWRKDPAGHAAVGGSQSDAAPVGQSDDPHGATVDSLVQLARTDLAAVFQEEATPQQLLEQVVQGGTRLVPGAEDAAVAVFAEGQLRTVAAVGEMAVALDEIRRAIGVAPSLDVTHTGRTLRVTDLSTDPRWIEFRIHAEREGARSLLACPLSLPHGQSGVLILYSSRPAAFDAAAELVVPVFAALAAIALAHADKVHHLERALHSRQLIGQAVGILMERHRISDKQAFDTLVTASQQSHIKVRELARRVTETGEEPHRQAAQTTNRPTAAANKSDSGHER